MAERSSDWMEQAERDLQMAQVARAEGFFEWACFIAQQAAEKAIEAVYQKEGAIAWGHSNTDLLRGIEQRYSVPKDILTSARRLDRFYIPARYPDGFGEGKTSAFL